MKQFIAIPSMYSGHGNRMTRPVVCQLEGGCHVVVSHKPGGPGYPRIRLDDVLYCLHRYVWEKHNGPIPEGLCVMHTCDNRMCINPKHLKVGTLGDNNRDMYAKGRAGLQGKNREDIIRRVADKNRGKPSKVKGSRNGNSRLVEAQVLEIRSLGGSVSKAELARRYSVDRKLIHLILLREVWKHV